MSTPFRVTLEEQIKIAALARTARNRRADVKRLSEQAAALEKTIADNAQQALDAEKDLRDLLEESGFSSSERDLVVVLAAVYAEAETLPPPVPGFYTVAALYPREIPGSRAL